jgi:RHS repeat-associated protein
MLIGRCSQVSSTLQWGSWHFYAGTASGELVNRYYSNGFGRFMTPDPSMRSAHPTLPQSWNRYPYVGGDPVNHFDPSGLTTCDENGDNCYDSVTVNGDTGEVTWSDLNYLTPQSGLGNYWDAQYTTIIAQWQAFQSELAKAYASANGCPFGETRMKNGTCDLQINPNALAVINQINQMNPGGFINAIGASMLAAMTAGNFALVAADGGLLLTSGSNVLMLGSDNYVNIAGIVGAATSSIPGSVWDNMTTAQQQGALEALIDSALANGSQIIFNLNPLGSEAGPWLQFEANYLLGLGKSIVQNSNGTWIVQ